ncbi:unnamed protein product [Chironomus riparius]|uniref:Transcription factor TFIIIC triple barrel domain-containing protein n=1 Tax=Chironomus riparius TaxID=315576 RepID=A0A9N9WSP5_9DIPT|nr:unnamed protein product [Chironomus riparius]
MLTVSCFQTKMQDQESENSLTYENSDNSDFVEEEILVYLDIEQTSISENEIRDAPCLRIVANDKNSLLQINNRFFEGKFDYSIGTHVFFERNENSAVDPLYCRCDSVYEFNAKTNKILSMNRVLLKDISIEDEIAQQAESKSEDNDLKVSKTYGQALNLFLTPKRTLPRKVNDDDEKVLIDLINTHSDQNIMETEELSTLTEAMDQNSLEPES